MLSLVKTAEEISITEHHKRVRALRCVVSDDPSVQLHHCKGGSMVELLGAAGNPGVGKKVSDWLVIPLNWRYHTGDFGIDNGQGPYKDKAAWEAAFGTQVGHLVQVSLALGYDVFHRAGYPTIRMPHLQHLHGRD